MSETFETYRSAVEEVLADYIPRSSSYETVSRAMYYSLSAKGKRIRPVLLLLFYRLCGGQGTAAVRFAAALEMIHTYSLIHDDLPCMDNDDLRRGKPSNHKVFGEDMALLAGDGLLTEAFTLAAQTTDIPAERVCRALRILGERAGYRGMVGGQVIDLLSEGKQISLEQLEELDRLKTGALLQAAAEIGCVLAGGDEADCAAAVAYGEKVGLAFQIVDDILDVTADVSDLGKPIGSDEKNEKCTYVSLLGLEKAEALAASLTGQALKTLQHFAGDTRLIEELTKELLHRQR